MIIGKFLDPRAPSLPQQVGINTDDIAEILQENEEQSANIQQNTDDIELLKQQVTESGTRVRVDGEIVAEWSPDELSDDLQQLRLAQSSDSLAIVGLQSDNITNKNNITDLQNDNITNKNNIANLDAKTLKTPISPPANIEIVGVGINNAQIMLEIEKFQPPINSYLIQKTGTISPASKFIGTWTKIAENVVFPLGNIAPVVKGRVENKFSPNWYDENGNQIINKQYLMVNNNANANTGLGDSTDGNISNLYTAFDVDLTQSTNAISGIDVWLREA